MDKKNWDYFNRDYTAADVTKGTVVLVFETFGMACGPISFNFLHLLKSMDEFDQFHAALAFVSDSTDEMTMSIPLESFLAEHQDGLLDDFNLKYEQQLPEGYQFNIQGDEELIAMAINAHNSLQF